MARIETDPNYSSPTFSRATAATDPFKKEDVQQVAAALSTHDHSNGKGAALVAGSIPAGSITSAMIADGTIQVGDLADGAVTSAKILDGTIATADLADRSVTNVKLGTDTARANLLTNGGMEQWQRGNGPFTTNGAWTADRWVISLGNGSMSVSRDTTNVDTASDSAAAITFTFGSTSQYLSQPLELGLAKGRQFTLSVRVRCSTANAVRIRIGGAVLANVFSPYHSGGGAYETLTVTATFPANETQAFAGLNFGASCTAYVDNAMLVVGSVAADYAPLHPADDLARCLRYYEVVPAGNGELNVTSYGATGIACMTPVPFKARKAVNPTLTKIGTWTVLNCSQPAPGAGGVDLVSIAATVTATGTYSFVNGAGCSITAEANP